MLKVISSRAELRVDVPALEAWKPAHLNEKIPRKRKKTNARTVILIREKGRTEFRKAI